MLRVHSSPRKTAGGSGELYGPLVHIVLVYNSSIKLGDEEARHDHRGTHRNRSSFERKEHQP
jgi:hypothetical protein